MSEALATKNFRSKFSLYLSLTKPGIVMGNMMSGFAGYLLAAKGLYSLQNFFLFSLGLSFVIGSSCVFNNCFDVELDQNMERTKNRPLAKEEIEKKHAFFFGTLLAFLGAFFLAEINMLTVFLAFLGMFLYVAVYTFFKYVSPYATIVGAFPGALPPVIGYTACNGVLDEKALLLFLLLFCWQIPHFYAITLFRLEEFKKARVPVWPIKKGIFATKIQMASFSVLFFLCASFFSFYFSSNMYLWLMGPFSLFWVGQCFKGFWKKEVVLWARSVFMTSILLIFFFSFLTLFLA